MAEKESIVTAEAQAAAEADLERLNTEREKNNKIRTLKRGTSAGVLYVSDLYPFPEDFDLDLVGPTSYLAQPEGKITGKIDTQEFSIKEELLAGLVFEEPGRKLEAGRSLRVVKALKPNGTLVQIGFEEQINNTAAGDVSDAIGVRYYQRKGYHIFMDTETMMPVYCFARNCWAAAMVPALAKRYPQHTDVMGSGYCSYQHMVFTEPHLGRDAQHLGTFGQGATTSRNWQRNS